MRPDPQRGRSFYSRFLPGYQRRQKAVTELSRQALLGDSPQEKVFVHCHYGEGRTGVFTTC